MAKVKDFHGLAKAPAPPPGIGATGQTPDDGQAESKAVPVKVVIGQPDRSHLMRYDICIAQGLRGTFELLPHEKLKDLAESWQALNSPEKMKPKDSSEN